METPPLKADASAAGVNWIVLASILVRTDALAWSANASGHELPAPAHSAEVHSTVEMPFADEWRHSPDVPVNTLSPEEGGAAKGDDASQVVCGASYISATYRDEYGENVVVGEEPKAEGGVSFARLAVRQGV